MSPVEKMRKACYNCFFIVIALNLIYKYFTLDCGLMAFQYKTPLFQVIYGLMIYNEFDGMQKLKNLMMMMRKRVNILSSGMNLENPLNLVSLRMQPTEIAWQNSFALRGI